MAHPLSAIADIRRQELPKVLLMFTYFLLVITTFWVLKPLKKGLFIERLEATGGLTLGDLHLEAAQAELVAKVLNMFVAFVAAAIFGALSDRYRRHQLTTLFSGFFIVTLFMYAPLLDSPGLPTVWTFYLYGDLYSTLMVATFFVFLNDIVTVDAAKRVYGVVVLGGVTGGFLGSNVVRGFIDALDRAQWMWVCAGVTALIVVIAQTVGRLHERELGQLRSQGPAEPVPVQPAVEQRKGSAALEGARLILRSRYLLSITLIVAVYEMVSTIMDFQFSATISEFCEGEEISKQIALAFAVMNTVAFAVQLLLTSVIMRKLGMAVALLTLPLTTALGSGLFLFAPMLWAGRLIPTFDGAFAYSINQSAKESLYVPATREEKYKAKAFIDMFVQRLAKAIAVGISLALTTWVTDFSAVRYLSLITLVLIVVWAGAAYYAGRAFRDLEEAAPKS